MITRLQIKNFKGFRDFSVPFKSVNVLVGGNNSGKTTVFHGLQLAFWCLDQTADVTDSGVILKKTQVPELGAVPYFHTRDLFFNQKIREGGSPVRIRLLVETDVAPAVEFAIYPAFSRNLLIDGGSLGLSHSEFEALQALKPIFIPGTIGITVKEEMYRAVAQERLITEGRQNQILRNLVFRLKGTSEWPDFVAILVKLFKLAGLDVPFDEGADEWLSATYKENDCVLHFVSAGSGFLQVVNLLSFLFLHSSHVALLDEPDSHMHEDLQRVTFDLLKELSLRRNVQLIIATHSPTFIDAAGLENVFLIDRSHAAALQAEDVDTLVPLLADQGLSLPPAKVMDTLKARRALFVEGYERDYEEFVRTFGEIVHPGFAAATRGLRVFETTGATKRWPFDAIAAFQKLIGLDLAYVYLSDRDFLTDDEIAQREATAPLGGSLIHLKRRNRESYLLEPEVLSRVLGKHYEAKKVGPLPAELTANRLKQRLVQSADADKENTRAQLIVQHEASLRLPAGEKVGALEKLNNFFARSYEQPLGRGELPVALMDSKKAIAQLRSDLASKYGISFSDREVLAEFRVDEVPSEIGSLVKGILHMCGVDVSKKSTRKPPSLTGARTRHTRRRASAGRHLKKK